MLPVHIDAILKAGIVPHGVSESSTDLEDIRKRGVGQRQGRCSEHRTRHIGSAIVKNGIHGVDGFTVGSRMGRCATSSLVHRNTDDY